MLHKAADNPESLEIILALLPIKDIVNLIRQNEIAYDSIPEALKNNKEILIAAKYPALDFVLQNAEYTAGASGAITLAAVEAMVPQWSQEVKAIASSAISLATYAGIKFFTHNLSQRSPSESLNIARTGLQT